MAELAEYRCFVGGLAWATDDSRLETAFRPYGEVVESKVPPFCSFPTLLLLLLFLLVFVSLFIFQCCAFPVVFVSFWSLVSFRHAVNWFLDVCVLNSASSCRDVSLCIDVRDFCW
jgi:hypothetical protein